MVVVISLTFALCLPACKALKPAGQDPKKSPGAENGYLTAKVAAMAHAMDHMPPEAKRYGDEFYAGAGIYDPDPAHAKVLTLALGDMHPPVVELSEIYTRDENSKWLSGRPAIVWTSKLERVTKDMHAFFVVGWMHSNLLYEFFEYETRYVRENDSWKVVDYMAIERPALSAP